MTTAPRDVCGDARKITSGLSAVSAVEDMYVVKSVIKVNLNEQNML